MVSDQNQTLLVALLLFFPYSVSKHRKKLNIVYILYVKFPHISQSRQSKSQNAENNKTNFFQKSGRFLKLSLEIKQ